jgi:hypothetical protein
MIYYKYVVIKKTIMMHNRNIDDLKKYFNLFVE